MTALVLPRVLRAQIAAEARAAYPGECCGLIVGEGFSVTALHPSRNLASAPDRFEIDPSLQFRLMREGRGIIGCYHSHPDGAAEPSARDAELAVDGDLVWLIAGAADSLAAYVWNGARFAPVPMSCEAVLKSTRPSSAS